VTVRFAPTSAASISSTLTLVSNDPSQPTASVSLSGQGTGGTAPTEDLVTDDGTVETGVYQNGLLAVNRLTPSRYPATLQTIRIFFQPFSGLPSPSGAQIRLVVFTDPAGQGRPPSGVQLLTSAPLTLGTIPAGGTFIDFPVTGVPSLSSGDLYVGFASPNPVGGVVFAADSNGVQRRRGWYSTDGGTTFLGPLGVSDGQGGVTPVNLLVRATVSIPGARADQELTEGSQP